LRLGLEYCRRETSKDPVWELVLCVWGTEREYRENVEAVGEAEVACPVVRIDLTASFPHSLS
jgi:hypothetical protein